MLDYDPKSRETDVFAELKKLLTLLGDDEYLIESFNKLLPKDLKVPQKN